MIKHRKKGKGITWKLEEKLAYGLPMGYGRLGFSFSYGTPAANLKNDSKNTLQSLHIIAVCIRGIYE